MTVRGWMRKHDTLNNGSYTCTLCIRQDHIQIPTTRQPLYSTVLSKKKAEALLTQLRTTHLHNSSSVGCWCRTV